MEQFKLENKLAIITGGGSGLGFSTAKGIVEAGGKVVITGRNENKLKKACEELGQNAFYRVNDITKLETIKPLIMEIEENIGKIDILVNNAGIHLKKFAVDTEDDEFDRVLTTHLKGSFAMSRECGKGMIERKSGAIIFITSMASIMGLPHTVAYTAAKSAMHGIVRTLAVEYSRHGVRVNSVAPGWIESEMLRQSFVGDEEREKRILARMPMGCIGEPKDIANAVIFLSSEASKYITGTEIRVDGGVSIGF